jgi:isochorismate hydrolase
MTRRALIVIDVQDSFLQQPRWAATSNPAIVSQVSALVRACRADSDRVIWVLHAEPGSGTSFDPDSGHVRLMDGLVPEAGEPLLTKTSHNAFTTTNLQQQLTCADRRADRLRDQDRAVLRDDRAGRIRPRLQRDVRDRRDGHHSDRAPGRAARPEHGRDPR